MSDSTIIETRKIPVKDGQVLEVEMTQKFIDHLREHFSLSKGQRLEDEHVKMYVWGAVNSAVDKAALEVKQDDDNSPTHAKRVRRTRRRKKDA